MVEWAVLIEQTSQQELVIDSRQIKNDAVYGTPYVDMVIIIMYSRSCQHFWVMDYSEKLE
jgi:hypothetical protein